MRFSQKCVHQTSIFIFAAIALSLVTNGLSVESDDIPSIDSLVNQEHQTVTKTTTTTTKRPITDQLVEGNNNNNNNGFEQEGNLNSTSKVIYVVTTVIIIYMLMVILLITSKRAQSYLIYLHLVNPPRILFPLTNLVRYRLSNHGRNIEIGNLKGWHILPPGEPFNNNNITDNEYFENRLKEKNQRIIIFFHGNSGNRSFPPKRIHLVKLLNSNFHAHIITFDYTGFGDSKPGHPSQKQIYIDCKNIVSFIQNKVSKTSSLFLYGQSLGTFPTLYISSNIYNSQFNNSNNIFKLTSHITGIILDAPPASIHHAALTHPIMKPFRIFGLYKFFNYIIKESFDNLHCATNCKFPILILHGNNDSMIPKIQGQMIADICKQHGNNDVNFYCFNNVGHIDVSGADLYLYTVWNFISRLEKQYEVGHVRN